MRRWAPWIAIVLGLALLAVSTAGMLRGVEPFASWYYSLAWYPTILVLDGMVALTGGAGERGRFLLLDRPAYLLSLLFWSAIIWLYYELFNLRLLNWYYVFLPHGWLLRGAGTFIAFATVLPALFVTEALLRGAGVARRMTWPALRVTSAFLTGMRITGAVTLALVLLWPRYFFPLVWMGTTLLVEPTVYERDPERSLLGDLEHGRPGRVLRLLLAGALIGLLWETFNIEARTKWIYTVPFFDELKLFEMPVLGFLGFPPFTVECFVLWQFLVTSGLAVDRDGAMRPASFARRAGAFVAASGFAVGVLAALDVRTVDSLRPRLADLEGVPAASLEAAGYDAFSLAAADPAAFAVATGGSARETAEWVERARLATLRGIGADNANLLREAGIGSVAELAAVEPPELADRLAAAGAAPRSEARLAVWVRAARQAMVDAP